MSEAKAYVGGMSDPSKMPGLAYGIPAWLCKLGAVLRQVKGSVCFGCYALKGQYQFPVVKQAQQRRFDALSRPRWVDAMSFILNRTRGARAGWMRWHDSGDLQSVDHLRRIVEVCMRTPRTRHWLPTREYGIVNAYLATGAYIPRNLTIRLSAHMIGRKAPDVPGLCASTVDGPGLQCPAPQQNNACGDCRACWDPTIPVVTYSKH